MRASSDSCNNAWRQGRVEAIADAKYRDLWEQSLPASMLYQLSVYALSQVNCQTAVILYATITSAAREARIAISDPIRGGARAWVVLRPVCLPVLADLVRQKRTATEALLVALGDPAAPRSTVCARRAVGRGLHYGFSRRTYS